MDVKLARTASEVSQVRDGLDAPLHGAVLRIARPEDTVAFKVLYATPQDLADARAILVRQRRRIDTGRLRSLASRLGVGAAVDALLAETGGG